MLTPGVDRDCRQALARFLLLPANEDVLRRIRGIIDRYVAGQGAGGGDDGSLYAVQVFLGLRDPGIVGLPLAREFDAYMKAHNVRMA